MEYTHTLTADNGEKFPYSEKINEYGYSYRISVILDDREAELFICNRGSHLEFDDDGSWLDFSIPPDSLFPNKDRLEPDELLLYMAYILEHFSEGKTYTKEQVTRIYHLYLEEKERERQQGH